jgi:hypothetical protein
MSLRKKTGHRWKKIAEDLSFLPVTSHPQPSLRDGSPSDQLIPVIFSRPQRENLFLIKRVKICAVGGDFAAETFVQTPAKTVFIGLRAHPNA